MKFYAIDINYISYLRQFDRIVPITHGVRQRPYLGIIVVYDGESFFAPLSSPKLKHITMRNNIDFIKIDAGKLGVINLNNMIPVNHANITEINPQVFRTSPNVDDQEYGDLLFDQLSWINSGTNPDTIAKRARNLLNMEKQGTLSDSLKSRCCSFSLLRIKCQEYANN